MLRKPILLFTLFIGVTVTLRAQSSTYAVKGVIVDSAQGSPLVMATVYMKDLRDSILLGYALTDTKGAFEVKDIPRDSAARFRIFYTGYSHYTRILKAVTPDVVDLGRIPLSMNAHELGTVTVTGEKPPIAIRGDTIEFNASSFKTRPNSVLSDLLKKLPGVDVDENGKVTANGKPVDKIMLDGKAFFGNDPKIAMQNLPSAIVDKVQITDTKTTEEEITGDPASGNTKTINLTIKKGMDHGYFGRAYAGYGTAKHYDASALVNYFRGKERITVLGASNNINKVGFTPDEAATMMGPDSRVFVNSSSGTMTAGGMNFGGGSGINKNTTGGLDYGNDFGGHTSVNGSYFYGDVDNQNDVQTSRQNILPDSLFYYQSDSRSRDVNQSHRINVSVKYKDSSWRITYQPYLGLSEENGTTQSRATSTGAKGNLINQSTSLYTTHETTTHFRNSLNIYRTFKQKGQFLGAYFFGDNNNTQNKNYNQYRNLFYDGSSPQDSANQFINARASKDQYYGAIAFRQPLTKDLSLQLLYNLNVQHGLTDKQTLDYDPVKGAYLDLDSTYSSKFRSNVSTQAPSAELIFKPDSGRWYFGLSANIFFIGLHHYSYTQDVSFDQHQVYFIPRISIRRQFKNKGSLNASYYANVRQPSVSQLLPITDNKNSLYQVRGNPDLKPALMRNASLGYSFYDPSSGNNLWFSLNYGSEKDAITSITSYDEHLRQLTTYTNVNNNDNWSAYLSLSKTKKKKDYHWQVKLETDASMGDNHAFVNKVPYTSRSYNLTARPMITYGYKDLFEINPSFRFDYQFNRYDIEALTNRKNTMYQAGASGTLYWPSRLTWTTDLDYTHNSDVAPGFSKGYWLWNASAGFDFMKDKRATLEFSVYDLLDQNQTVRRSITDTYIQDTQTMMLQRYFMIKLIYNLRKQDKKKEKSKQIYIF